MPGKRGGIEKTKPKKVITKVSSITWNRFVITLANTLYALDDRAESKIST